MHAIGGHYSIGPRGVWILGRRLIRFLCLSLNLEPPRWKGQSVPTLSELLEEAKVQFAADGQTLNERLDELQQAGLSAILNVRDRLNGA